MELPNFPLQIRGQTRYALTDLKVENGDLAIASSGDLDVAQGLDALAQKIELGFRTKIRANADPDDVRSAIEAAFREEGIQEYVEPVTRASVEGSRIEVDFVAAGYPGTYRKVLDRNGKLATHPLVTLP